MRIFIFLLVLSILIGVSSFLYLRKMVLLRRPSNAPTINFIRNLKTEDKRIVFAGDSNTHGNMSYNWIKEVDSEFVKINAGVNGDLSSNLLQRLNEIIDCRPDYVCILIGTNDVNAGLNRISKKRYVSNGKIGIDQKVDIYTFQENLRKVVTRIKMETRSKIALMSLPLMGEELGSDVNKLADDYSEVIQNIAADENVSFIDIRAELKSYLVQNQKVEAPKFEKYYFVMLKSIYLHFYFGISFDKLSQMNGMLLSHDQLHLNSISGQIIANQVSNWLKEFKQFEAN